MTEIVRYIVELASLTAASIVWMSVKDPEGLLLTGGVGVLGIIIALYACNWLRRQLPSPRGLMDAFLYGSGLLAALACAAALAASYAIGHAGEALTEMIATFTRESFSGSASGWQRSTFDAAAGRVAALGPDYAKQVDEALHGGLTLPIVDAIAAKAVQEVYAERTFQRMAESTDWKYALWSRWLPVNYPSESNDSWSDISTNQIITGDPGASALTQRAVTGAGSALAWFIASTIEDYLLTRQLLLWLPALVLWVLTLGLIWLTASLRLDQNLARLSRMP